MHVRDIDWETDADSLCRIDSGFETNQVLELSQQDLSFSFEKAKRNPSVSKRYEFSLTPEVLDEADTSLVAIEKNVPIAYLVSVREEWNSRLVISHFYVDRNYRGRGAGRALFSELLRRIPDRTRHVFVETQNVNLPAIAFYRKMGFAICGFDAALYDGEEKGEVAIFLSLPIR